MKTSNKWLSSMILVLFLAPASLKIVERMCLKLESGYSASGFADQQKDQPGDSTAVPAPADDVNWTRINLGLRRSFRRGIIGDSSIFRDLHLAYLGNSCSTGPYFRPFNDSWICLLGFDYKKIESDSVTEEGPGYQENNYIDIDILKYKNAQPSFSISEYKKKAYKAKEFQAGVWEYWMFDGACCEWTMGRWFTLIRVPLRVCGNDSARAVELRDKIRDRLFTYYKTLR